LVRYTDTRLHLFYQGLLGEPQAGEKLRESEQLEATIRSRVAAASNQNPSSVPVGQALEALSGLSDLNAKRRMAMTKTVPTAMMIALVIAQR
jgi:hypothetical protein